MKFKTLLLLLLLLPAACGGAAEEATPAEPLLVAAASDLQFAFTEMGERYEGETGREVTITFGSTGNQTTQIENGAPIDIRPTSLLSTS